MARIHCSYIWRQFVLSGDTQSVAKGISNNGIIVGQSSSSLPGPHAFVVGLAGPPGSAIAALVNLNAITYQYVNGQYVLVGSQSGGWSLLSASGSAAPAGSPATASRTA